MDNSDLNALKTKILGAKLTRLAPITIIDSNPETLEITFAVDTTEDEGQFFGNEHVALLSIGTEDAAGTDCLIDADKVKIVGTLQTGFLSNDGICVKVKFTAANLFREAQSPAFNRVELKYNPCRIQHARGNKFNILSIMLVGFSLCTESYAPKGQYRKHSSLFDGAQNRTVNVRWPGENGIGGNAQILGNRRVVLKFYDSKPWEPKEGEDHLKLTGNGNVNFAKFIGRKLFPCRAGLTVDGAEPLGIIQGIVSRIEKIRDPKKDGKKIIFGHVSMEIELLDTLPGQREWAAMQAGDARATVMGFKAYRLTRYADGQNFINDIFNWEPTAIGIESGIVMTAAEVKAAPAPAEPPAPVKPPGFIGRLVNALTPGGAS
jgi:hypothetical protein